MNEVNGRRRGANQTVILLKFQTIMEWIVANVDNMRFDIEIALDEQYGALPLPFTGMDST